MTDPLDQLPPLMTLPGQGWLVTFATWNPDRNQAVILTTPVTGWSADGIPFAWSLEGYIEPISFCDCTPTAAYLWHPSMVFNGTVITQDEAEARAVGRMRARLNRDNQPDHEN